MARRPHNPARLHRLPHAVQVLHADGTVRLDQIPDTQAVFIPPPPTDYQYTTHSAAPLFVPYPAPGDALQKNQTGNCWEETFDQELSIHFPADLMHLVQMTADGRCVCHYFTPNQPADTVITDLTVQAMDVGKRCLWGSMREKTLAFWRVKMNTIGSLNNGNTAQAAIAAGYLWTYKTTNVPGIATVIAATWDSNISQTLSTAGAPVAGGLVGNHSWGVDGYYVDAWGVLWIRLRNPWGYAHAVVNEAMLRDPRNFSGWFTTTGRSSPLPAMQVTTEWQRYFATMERICYYRGHIIQAGKTLPAMVKPASGSYRDAWNAYSASMVNYQKVAV